MPEVKTKRTGAERAAILLMSLGEDSAAEIVKHLSPKEVQKLGEAMAVAGDVSQDLLNDVLTDFTDTVGTQTSVGIGNEEYLRNVLVNSLGEDKGGAIIDRILLGRGSKGLGALKWMEPRAIAEIIRLEHPQIIAIVLSYLDSDQAADVLAALPENMRSDIVMRVASLDGIQPSALEELDDILEKQLSGTSGNIKASSVGGKKAAANILNFMGAAAENEIIDKVKNSDEELGQAIQDLMFVFDNLADVDDRSIQSLLREISSDTLILALKGADPGVADKILKNMSKRAAEMLRDDLEARGPVRVSEVEVAQKEILSVARRMAEAGDLSLTSGGGDDFV
ncbi:MAG: flagellar motor switch protein FliG [Gammaproteobacteria bacterium]|nr:flagellar motor switch protein FliG [Gammaproteobacteria bacterium]